MKKNGKAFLGIAALAMAATLALAGCPNDSNNNGGGSVDEITLAGTSYKVGATLTASYPTAIGGIEYWWEWADTSTAATGTGIADEHDPTLVIPATSGGTDLVGKYLRAAAITGGAGGSKQVYSKWVGPVTAASSGGNTDDITYTVSPAGSPTTTSLAFAFSSAVSSLDAAEITIANGTGSAAKGALNGGGTTWTLDITTATAGTVSVSIAKSGIESGAKTVTLAKDSGGTPATVDSVTVSPMVTIKKGGTRQFHATVTGTNNPSQAVTWSVTVTGGGYKHDDTTISANGVLTVAAAETNTKLTVRATSTADSTRSGTTGVQVSSDDITLTPSGGPNVYKVGDTLTASTTKTIQGNYWWNVADTNTSWSNDSVGNTSGSRWSVLTLEAADVGKYARAVVYIGSQETYSHWVGPITAAD